MIKKLVASATIAVSVVAGTGFTARAAGWPSRVFAPYMYIGADDSFQITKCDDACGQKYYTLAFIIADKENNPAWDGQTAMEENLYADQIAEIRRRGGDVIMSFGGESGAELATVEKDPNALQAKYQSVLDRYKFTRIDIDVEGDALKNTGANERRNTVLAKLQTKNPGLVISYTLPADPNGISEESQKLLSDAKSKGVKIYCANIMTMFFGPDFTKDRKLGDLSIASAIKTHQQCQTIDPVIKIGLTPNIGQVEDKTETFTEADARTLKAWADRQTWVCSLSFWSCNRDTGKLGKPDDTSSGIPQEPWAFTKTFKSFTQP